MNLSHRRILVRGLFVLALLAVGGLPSVSAQTQTTLPPCTMDIPDTDGDGETAMDIDKDGDGLIEICDLEGLDEMRYVSWMVQVIKQLTATVVVAVTTGCPSVGGCTGYELTRHLNFMSAQAATVKGVSIPHGRTQAELAGNPLATLLRLSFSLEHLTADGYTLSNLMINRSSSD